MRGEKPSVRPRPFMTASSSVVHRARESPWPAVSMDDALRSIGANFGDLRAVEKKIGDLRSGLFAVV
ncbi:hypothetical protein M3Y99_01678800 [Aphelenchoides fujianensis]|nr:hypothetical protein M3Y99_01678800 [Aphelenchoides fujianensis]